MISALVTTIIVQVFPATNTYVIREKSIVAIDDTGNKQSLALVTSDRKDVSKLIEMLRSEPSHESRFCDRKLLQVDDARKTFCLDSKTAAGRAAKKLEMILAIARMRQRRAKK